MVGDRRRHRDHALQLRRRVQPPERLRRIDRDRDDHVYRGAGVERADQQLLVLGCRLPVDPGEGVALLVVAQAGGTGNVFVDPVAASDLAERPHRREPQVGQRHYPREHQNVTAVVLYLLGAYEPEGVAALQRGRTHAVQAPLGALDLVVPPDPLVPAHRGEVPQALDLRVGVLHDVAADHFDGVGELVLYLDPDQGNGLSVDQRNGDRDDLADLDAMVGDLQVIGELLQGNAVPAHRNRAGDQAHDAEGHHDPLRDEEADDHDGRERYDEEGQPVEARRRDKVGMVRDLDVRYTSAIRHRPIPLSGPAHSTGHRPPPARESLPAALRTS